MQRLLSSGIRTADGDVADYFFVPMSIRAPSESMSMVKAVTYIRSHWPWWDRLEGARHLFVHTGESSDVRVCESTWGCSFVMS